MSDVAGNSRHRPDYLLSSWVGAVYAGAIGRARSALDQRGRLFAAPRLRSSRRLESPPHIDASEPRALQPPLVMGLFGLPQSPYGHDRGPDLDATVIE